MGKLEKPESGRCELSGSTLSGSGDPMSPQLAPRPPRSTHGEEAAAFSNTPTPDPDRGVEGSAGSGKPQSEGKNRRGSRTAAGGPSQFRASWRQKTEDGPYSLNPEPLRAHSESGSRCWRPRKAEEDLSPLDPAKSQNARHKSRQGRLVLTSHLFPGSSRWQRRGHGPGDQPDSEFFPWVVGVGNPKRLSHRTNVSTDCREQGFGRGLLVHPVDCVSPLGSQGQGFDMY